MASAGEAVAAIIASGVVPAGLEMMDALTIEAAEARVGAGYPRDAAAILLCELDGDGDEATAEAERVANIARENGATAIRHAQSEAERALLWAGRKEAFPALGRLSPDYYCIDGTIPRHRLAEVLTEIGALGRAIRPARRQRLPRRRRQPAPAHPLRR